MNGVAADWTIQGTNDRLLADDLVEDGHRVDQNDFTEIDQLLGQASIWQRVMRLAKALEARHRIDIPELTEFLRPQVTSA